MRPPPEHALTSLAVQLGVSVEELVGAPASAKHRAGKRGPAPKLQRQLERISQLTKARQRVVSEVLDSLIGQARR